MILQHRPQMRAQFRPLRPRRCLVGLAWGVQLSWQSERNGIENKWYALTGRVVTVKVEADGDLHLALQDATGNKLGMVACEIPAKSEWYEIRQTVLVGR
jgi:hypothetical protein